MYDREEEDFVDAECPEMKKETPKKLRIQCKQNDILAKSGEYRWGDGANEESEDTVILIDQGWGRNTMTLRISVSLLGF